MSGLQLSSMESSEMLDVIHYLFEEDLTSSSNAEQLEAKDRVRSIIYRDFYDHKYKYGSGKNDYNMSNEVLQEGLVGDEEDDLQPFDPTKAPIKPYFAPTNPDEKSVKPFGMDIDAPLG
jgi:hypothetical protein